VAPETGNARLPTVERRTGGTSRRCEVEDRSRRHSSVVPVSLATSPPLSPVHDYPSHPPDTVGPRTEIFSWLHWSHLASEGCCRRLRSTSDRMYCVPRSTDRTHYTFGDRSFAVADASQWNGTLSHGLYRRRTLATEKRFYLIKLRREETFILIMRRRNDLSNYLTIKSRLFILCVASFVVSQVQVFFTYSLVRCELLPWLPRTPLPALWLVIDRMMLKVLKLWQKFVVRSILPQQEY